MAVVLADPELHAYIGGEPASAASLARRYRRRLAGTAQPGVSWCNWMIRMGTGGELAGTAQATIVPGNAGGGAPVAEIAWVVGT